MCLFSNIWVFISYLISNDKYIRADAMDDFSVLVMWAMDALMTIKAGRAGTYFSDDSVDHCQYLASHAARYKMPFNRKCSCHVNIPWVPTLDT